MLDECQPVSDQLGLFRKELSQNSDGWYSCHGSHELRCLMRWMGSHISGQVMVVPQPLSRPRSARERGGPPEPPRPDVRDPRPDRAPAGL